MNQVVPPSLLFQFAIQVPRLDNLPRAKGRLLQLPDSTRLFVPATLNHQHADAGAPRCDTSAMELRMAWNPDGLGIAVSVSGKRHAPAGRWKDLKTSDHVLLWFDTRHTANVHRATGYCSSLAILPSDDDAGRKPSAQAREIAQQRELRQLPDVRRVQLQTHVGKSGYELEVWIPAGQLHGFREVPEIGHFGFCLVVEDTELGSLPLNLGGDFPVSFDPSTWVSLETG